jgi:hypothetical protein
MVENVVTFEGLFVQFKYEELGCAFGIVGKILMNKIQWNLFREFCTLDVADIKI